MLCGSNFFRKKERGGCPSFFCVFAGVLRVFGKKRVVERGFWMVKTWWMCGENVVENSSL
jgi:hypothetical protein